MGWCFGEKSKSELVAELREQGKDRTCVASRLVGNHLWSVWENHNTKEKFISLDLLVKQDGEWSWKDLSEPENPFYYDCPAKFLELVPDGSIHACADWREGVRAYYQEKEQSKLKKKIGTQLRVKEGVGHLAGIVFKVNGVLPRKQACIVGCLGYRLKPSQVEIV